MHVYQLYKKRAFNHITQMSLKKLENGLGKDRETERFSTATIMNKLAITYQSNICNTAKPQLLHEPPCWNISRASY